MFAIALQRADSKPDRRPQTTTRSIAALLFATAAWSAQAQDDLVYIAVEPCRVADTRIGQGFIPANTVREFLVDGSAAQLAAQGGTVDCLNPKAGDGQRPVAVAAYILAVPTESSSGGGVLSAYPADQDPPPVGSGSTVNFRDAPIGNTSIVTLCSSNNCPQGGELAVISRNSDEDVVIDVQGYFYPHVPGAIGVAFNAETIVEPGPPVEVVSTVFHFPADGFVLLTYTGEAEFNAGESIECGLSGEPGPGLGTGASESTIETLRVAMKSSGVFPVAAGALAIAVDCVSEGQVLVQNSRLSGTFSTTNLAAF